MNHRGLHCELQCEVCQQCSLETANHLFFQCIYARGVWTGMNMMLGADFLQNGDTILASVDKSWRACQRRFSRDKWGSYFFAVCWFLWRARNKLIFEGCTTDSRWLAQHALKEAKLWMKYC